MSWTPLPPPAGPLLPGGSLTFTPPPGLIDPNRPEQTFVIRYVASSLLSPIVNAAAANRALAAPVMVAGEIVIRPPVAPNGTASATPPHTMNLRWPETSGAVNYEVWRLTAPYAVPGTPGTTPIGHGAPDGVGSWALSDGSSNLGNVGLHTFYTIVVYNSAGQPSQSRNYEGEFEFALVSGAP